MGIVAVGTLLFAGVSFWLLTRPIERCPDSLSKFAEVKIGLETTPALYEPVDVEVSFKPCRDPKGETEAWMELPPSAAFIGGDLRWRGTLRKGETGRFGATIAFVAEGTSVLHATARVSPPGALIRGGGISAHAFVTAEGRASPPEGTPTPTPFPVEPSPVHVWERRDLQHGSFGHLALDGTTLVNAETEPRAFLVYDAEGLAALEGMGLVPPYPWGSENESLMEVGFDFERRGLLFALYDARRPTTGNVLSVLKRSDRRPSHNPPDDLPSLLVDILAVAPSDEWPVEHREVSPYDLLIIPGTVPIPRMEAWPEEYREVLPYDLPAISEAMVRAEVETLILRVNDEVVSEYEIDRTGETSIQELDLPPIQTMVIQ